MFDEKLKDEEVGKTSPTAVASSPCRRGKVGEMRTETERERGGGEQIEGTTETDEKK